MYITQFGSYTLPDQLELSESGGASRRGSSQPLGGAGGAVDLNGTGPDPLEADEIVKSFWLDAGSDTALRTSLDALLGGVMLSENDWRQGTRLLIATMPDGSQRVTWAKGRVVQLQWQYYNINEGWVPAQVTWRREWPVWLAGADLRYFGDHLGDFQDADDAGWLFGGGDALVEESVSSSPHTFTITNNGNSRVMAGVIEFDGEITNPKLENLRNGHYFQYSGTLASGDRLTVYPEKFDARYNGATAWSSLTLGSDKGQLLPMVLEPGSNPMRITGSGISGLTFRYYWAKTYF